jgi:hypothetical protein
MRVIEIIKWAGVAFGLLLYPVQYAAAEEIFQFGVDCVNCDPAPENLPAPLDYTESNHKGTAKRKVTQRTSIPATNPTTRRQ